MSRPAKFTPEQIIDATARIAARSGPAKATIGSIAAELQAPSGSIYHRFGSRDLLLGEVWLRAAEAFQAEIGAVLAGPDPLAAGLAAALQVPKRVRQQPIEARILLLHRREDFLAGGWPDALTHRAAQLKARADDGIRRFSKRLLGRSNACTLAAITYAVAGAPLAAVLPYLRADKSPPPAVERLISATYNAVMQQLATDSTPPLAIDGALR